MFLAAVDFFLRKSGALHAPHILKCTTAHARRLSVVFCKMQRFDVCCVELDFKYFKEGRSFLATCTHEEKCPHTPLNFPKLSLMSGTSYGCAMFK